VDNIWKNIIRAAFVLVGLCPVVMVIYFALFRTLTKDYLLLVLGAELAVLLFIFGVIVLYALATDQIRIDMLISDPDGDASISRFQLLIFTFTIALSFVYLVIMGPGRFPDVPNQVLILLGISASTYGVGKGLQVAGGMVSNSSPQPPPAGPDNPPAKSPDDHPTSGN
jgi:hypothetical protein